MWRKSDGTDNESDMETSTQRLGLTWQYAHCEQRRETLRIRTLGRDHKEEGVELLLKGTAQVNML